MLIGLSLRFCIKDIINDEVLEDDIRYIISNTECKTDEEWLAFEKEGLRLHWNNDIRGSLTLKRLLEGGKILQPKLIDPTFRVNLDKGRWFINLTEKEFRNEQVPSDGYGFGWIYDGPERRTGRGRRAND